MQRTIKTLVPRRHLRPAFLHLPRPCTCPSIPIASRTFMNYAAPRNSDTSSSSSSSSSSTSSTSSTSTPGSEEELSMEEKLARHRARVAAGRAKRHAELEAQAAAEAAGLPWPPEGSESENKDETTSSSTTSTTTSSDSTSSTRETASTDAKPSPPRSSFDIRKFIRSEIHNIRQHVKKYSEPPKTPIVDKTEKKLDQKEKTQDQEEEEPVSDGKFYAPMTLESDETVWEQRIQRWSERTRSAFSTPFRSVRRTVKSSDNVVVKKIGEAQVKVTDRIEEIQEDFETTQNPTIWKMRDIGERALGEQPAAVAKNELDEQLPGFNAKQFLRDVKGLYVPMILKWLEQKDMPKLRSIIEKETPASSFLISFFKGREEDEKKYIMNFVGLRKISIARLTLVNEQPWVVLTFSVGVTKIPRTGAGSMPTTGSQPVSTSSSSSSSSSSASSSRASSSSSSSSSSAIDDDESSSSSSSSSSSFPPSPDDLHERERLHFTLALCPDTRPENPFGWRIAEIAANQIFKIKA